MILLFLQEDFVQPFSPSFSRSANPGFCRRARLLSIVRTCTILAGQVCPAARSFVQRSRHSPTSSFLHRCVSRFRVSHRSRRCTQHLMRAMPSLPRTAYAPRTQYFQAWSFASTMPVRVYVLRPANSYNICRSILQIARTVFRRARPRLEFCFRFRCPDRPMCVFLNPPVIRHIERHNARY